MWEKNCWERVRRSKSWALQPRNCTPVVFDCLTGNPAEMIVEAARAAPASLLVLRACPDDTKRGSMGTVAERILNAAPASLLLIVPDRREEPWSIRRILVAHDGTPTADSSIGAASDLAARAKAEVIAMHVVAPTSAQPQEPGSLTAPRYMDQPQHEWPAWASEFLNRMLALGAPPTAVTIKLLVTGGQPGSELAHFARENSVDLGVVTWQAHWEEPHAGTLKAVKSKSRLSGAASQSPRPA